MCAAILAWCQLLAGCASPPNPPPPPAVPAPAIESEAPAVTPKLTEADYEQVVKSIATEILRRGLPSGAVVMLGPVDTKHTLYSVDIEKLQTEISAAIGTSGDVQLAVRQGVLANEPAAAEMYKLIDLNWANANPISPVALQKFGKMAKINEIIFGRVSTQEDPLAGGGHLVTHTFAWSLGNVETGTLDLTPIIVKIRKYAFAAPAAAKEPLWWVDPKTEDNQYRYFVANVDDCSTQQAARDSALVAAQNHILMAISSDLASRKPTQKLWRTNLPGVDEVAFMMDHGPGGWSCWVMVSYPIELFSTAIQRALNQTNTMSGQRQKVLVAPITFDQAALKDFAKVIDFYRNQGYGWDLWRTVEDALEDSPDFVPDTRPTKVMEELVGAVESGEEVPGDIPEYLLVPNANFFDFTEEELHGWTAISNTHHHVTVHLGLYKRVSGHWQRVTTAMSEKVDMDLLEATNTGVRTAVKTLLDRWRDKQAGSSN